jgi:amino acid transporter
MAADGYLPRVFARSSKTTGVPWVSVIACSLGWLATLGLSFDRLLSLDILLYGASLALEFAALVVLRVREPELARPMRVPGGTPIAVLLGAAPLAMVGFALVKTAGERVGPLNALVFGALVAGLGPVAYALTLLVRLVRSRPPRPSGNG